MSAPVSAPPPIPTRSRAAMITERQKNSIVWRIIHLLGSLKLALVLLTTIAAACAIATFTESRFNTEIAQRYIYHAPWFIVWLLVLCVNLFAVTLTRWPWQKKHWGFVITHYGIITLLVGSMIGMIWGFEGNVVLRKDGPPVTRVVTSTSIIQLESPVDGGVYLMPFNGKAAGLGNGRTKDFPVPNTKLKVVADDYSANLLEDRSLIASTSPGSGPGVQLKLTSQMMGQTLEMPLALGTDDKAEGDLFGLARIALLRKLPDAPLPAPRETQMVFARFAPVTSGAVKSGINLLLSADGEEVTIQHDGGDGHGYRLRDILGKKVDSKGAIVEVSQYWPDFVMKDGAPGTRSDSPNNPAMLAHITPASGAPAEKPTPRLDMVLEGNQIAYRLSRGGVPYQSGTAAAGTSFPLGWADWQATVEQALPRAAIITEPQPGPALTGMTQGIPGLHLYLVGPEGRPGPARWASSGEVVSLTEGTNIVRFGYGLETRPLPFSIRLERFDVPRDEGTDTPSNFLATVEFRDAKTGQTKTGVAEMNRPASFPGTLWANLTGFNYKFSQAEWNPRDLQETTLQVLFDPGWLLKWVGSLGICIGIGIMFYAKPK